MIESQSGYMNKIVADLQDFVRPIKPEVEEVDAKEVIDGALSSMTIPKDIVVEKMVNEVKIAADPMLIKRVLNNLIVNSIQAMSSGGRLTLKAQREDDMALISVSDTGVGMSEDVRPKLFTPLFTTKSKGQGFGLAVCKRIVEAHNGEISFESEVGKGTTFILRLPQRSNAA